MGPGIVIPVLVIAIVVPFVVVWANKNLRGSGGDAGDLPTAPSVRLTSNALRDLPVPPWRVVYEIADDKLGGIEHVLIGPPGIYAVQTLLDPMPAAPQGDPDAHDIARAAIARGDLDDALRRCAMATEGLVRVHWGKNDEGTSAVDILPGTVAVAGAQLTTWTGSLPHGALTPAQVDLAWQTVVTAIGRPDPLR